MSAAGGSLTQHLYAAPPHRPAKGATLGPRRVFSANTQSIKPKYFQKYSVPLHDGSGAEATLDDLSDGGARKHRRMDENASSSFLRKKERKHTHTENNIL